MSYQPLHHKYRPQTFTDLVGQEAIATTLTHALQQQRIAPAYLFTGARGTGKTSSARILAKSLNCQASETPTEHPCGLCEVCRSIAGGSALDVIEIDAASNTGVDNIRELIERAQFAPVQCRYKVYVIDECHMLSSAAFNALLKTLEEPPDRVVFVLATTDPQRVLPTIISRCQRFDFRRIPLEAMVRHLRAIADKEAIAISDEAITLVAQLSQGGLRDAESLLDQLSLLAGEVSAEKVWDLVGSVPERDLLTLLEAIAQDNPETLLDSTRRLMDRGREPMIVLQNLASFYRDLLIAKTAPDRGDLVALTPPTWEKLCSFAQSLDTATILAGQQHLRSCELQLKSTTQPRLWLEVTLMGLLPSALPQARETRIEPTPRAERKPAVPVRPAEIAPPVAPPDPPPVSVPAPQPAAGAPAEPAPRSAEPPPSIPVSQEAPAAELTQIWQQVIDKIVPYSTQVMVRQQCHLLALQEQEARIGVTTQPLFKMAQGKIPNIEAAFTAVFGTKIRVSLEVAALEPGRLAKEPSSANGSMPAPAPAAPTYQPPVPAGEVPKAPPVAQPRPLPQPDPLPAPASPDAGYYQAEDEVSRAAKQLAEFFAGKVVDLSDSAGELPVTMPEVLASHGEAATSTFDTWGGPEDEDEDEIDIPF